MAAEAKAKLEEMTEVEVSWRRLSARTEARTVGAVVDGMYVNMLHYF